MNPHTWYYDSTSHTTKLVPVPCEMPVETVNVFWMSVPFDGLVEVILGDW